MVHTRFEVTILEPIIEIEAMTIVMAAEARGWEANIMSSGRILIINGPKQVKNLIKFLAMLGFCDDVGLIRKIVDYEQDDYEKELMEYNQNEL